jgi:hypothetical protein
VVARQSSLYLDCTIARASTVPKAELWTFAREHCFCTMRAKWNRRSERATLARFEAVTPKITSSQA